MLCCDGEEFLRRFQGSQGSAVHSCLEVHWQARRLFWFHFHWQPQLQNDAKAPENDSTHQELASWWPANGDACLLPSAHTLFVLGVQSCSKCTFMSSNSYCIVPTETRVLYFWNRWSIFSGVGTCKWSRVLVLYSAMRSTFIKYPSYHGSAACAQGCRPLSGVECNNIHCRNCLSGSQLMMSSFDDGPVERQIFCMWNLLQGWRISASLLTCAFGASLIANGCRQTQPSKPDPKGKVARCNRAREESW